MLITNSLGLHVSGHVFIVLHFLKDSFVSFSGPFFSLLCTCSQFPFLDFLPQFIIVFRDFFFIIFIIFFPVFIIVFSTIPKNSSLSVTLLKINFIWELLSHVSEINCTLNIMQYCIRMLIPKRNFLSHPKLCKKEEVWYLLLGI